MAELPVTAKAAKGKSFPLLLLISVIILAVIYAFIFQTGSQTLKSEAFGGVACLADRELCNNSIIRLDGQWEFYWQQLIYPEQFSFSADSYRKDTIQMPRLWNKQQVKQDTISGSGYATYRLTVINLDTENVPVYALKIPVIFSAYTVWANQQLLFSYGSLTNGARNNSPYANVSYIPAPENGRLELVLHVANYRHRGGGIAESILLGSAEAVSRQVNRNIAFDLLLFGSLFIIGFYHLVFFFFRKKEKSYFFLGLFSLLISVRTLFVGEIYFLHLFPSFNWEVAHKMLTLTYYLGVAVFLLLLDSVFPELINRRILKGIMGVSLSFSAIVILTPTTVFTYLNPLYQLYSLLVILYIFYILFMACKENRNSAYATAIGVTVLLLTAVNDIIYLSILVMDSGEHFLRRFISGGNLSAWGLLFFIFTHSFILASKLSANFAEVESVREKLLQLNQSLEDKVKKRTLALESSNKELQQAYASLANSEKSLHTLIQNISHDLKTPLTIVQGYINAILDGLVEPSQQEKYLLRVRDKVNNLGHMVGELLDSSSRGPNTLDYNYTFISIRDFTEYFRERCSLDMTNSPLSLSAEISPALLQEKQTLSVHVDMKKIERVMLNLLHNAQKFSPAGDTVHIGFSLSDGADYLIVEVKDRGIGIAEADLPYIFQRFYKVSRSRPEDPAGSGLGLAIAREIIEHHNGRIWAESKLKDGSSFFFTLPIIKKARSIQFH